MKLGFAGLGLMGFPMAANLVRAGFPLVAYNRSPGPREALQHLGARTFDEPTGFFAACHTVILMLADDRATDEVLGRGTAEFSNRVGAKLIVNMGTHAPAWSKALESDLTTAGARFVEAPVSGSRGPAEAGELVAMLAGDQGGIEQLRPVLTHLCRETVTAGAVPSAMACKIAVNLYLIASVAALAEAATLAKKLGLDPGTFAQVIGRGPLGSDVARAKLSKMISRDFAPQASIRDVRKNAGLVAETATAVRLDAAVLDAARRLFDRVLDSGGAELDMAGVITALEREVPVKQVRAEVYVAADAPGKSATSYPPPFSERVKGRFKRPLGDLFGIASFGVNLTTLQPGAQSSVKHRHMVQDEFVYVLSGTLVLAHDEGETPLTAGMCAGFPHGGTAHHLLNRSDAPATYLEVGDRRPGDAADYPDDDLIAMRSDGAWRFTHKDGTPY